MSIFSRIKDAIFGKKAEAATPPPPVAEAAPAVAPPEPASIAISDVDVVSILTQMAGDKELNWQTSIVDLMKLLGIDASYENRKELAVELGNAGYSGSAEDNIALHKQVMKGLAENGGMVPAEMLD